MAHIMQSKTGIGLAMLVALSMLVLQIQAASANVPQSGISRLMINATSLTFNGYGYYNTAAADISYNALLVNGTSGNTSIQIVAGTAGLYKNGIIAIPTPAYGDPNFSGILKIQIANFTAPGNYSMELALVGADPSPNATLTLVVLPWKGNLNATPLAKFTSLSTTSMPFSTTIPASAPAISAPDIEAIIAAVVVIVIIILALPAIRRRMKYGF